MPKPNKGEKRADYIHRAMKEMMGAEGMKQRQALGKAYGMWDAHMGAGRKKKKSGLTT